MSTDTIMSQLQSSQSFSPRPILKVLPYSVLLVHDWLLSKVFPHQHFLTRATSLAQRISFDRTAPTLLMYIQTHEVPHYITSFFHLYSSNFAPNIFEHFVSFPQNRTKYLNTRFGVPKTHI